MKSSVEHVFGLEELESPIPVSKKPNQNQV